GETPRRIHGLAGASGGACGPRTSSAELLYWLVARRRKEKRRAHGRALGSRPCAEHARVAASLRRTVALERCRHVAAGPRLRFAGNAENGTGDGMDCGRDQLCQEGHSFGGSGTAVLWPGGKDGELPGSGESIGGYRNRESAHSLAVVPAGGMGQRSSAAPGGGCTQAGAVSDQAADCAGAD